VTEQYILRAAIQSMIKGHRKPHCFYAHKQGEGYTNNGETPEEREDYLKQLYERGMQETENLPYASGYAEPGYTQPKKTVLLADWNVYPKEIWPILEKYGFALEWSDEWGTCNECYKAFRISPDSHGWEPAYVINKEGIFCKDCNPDKPETSTDEEIEEE